jgi:hypothetical protein
MKDRPATLFVYVTGVLGLPGGTTRLTVVEAPQSQNAPSYSEFDGRPSDSSNEWFAECDQPEAERRS